MQISGKPHKSGENGRYLVALGSNQISGYGPPLATLIATLALLESRNIKVLARSPWFESEPVPKSEQGWFVNGAICVSTLETSNNLLKILHEIESEIGRVRSVPNAARPIDLDLLAILNCGGTPSTGVRRPLDEVERPSTAQELGGKQGGVGTGPDLSGNALILPHPRLNERAFVLQPLLSIAPSWVHPTLNLTVTEMAATLPEGPIVRLLRPERDSGATP